MNLQIAIDEVPRILKCNLHPSENHQIIKNFEERYEIKAAIGAGGQASFYSVQLKDKESNDQKIYGAKEYNNYTESLIKDEFILLSQIKSDFIVHVYELTKRNEKMYLISDFFSEGALEKKSLIYDFKNDNVCKFVFLATFANSIWYLQSQRNLIIHHDIKPSNVCIEQFEINGKMYSISKLIDFGFYKQSTMLTNSAGTLRYEVRFAGHHYTIESDIFSFLYTVYLTLESKSNTSAPFIKYFLTLRRILTDEDQEEEELQIKEDKRYVVPSMDKIMLIFACRPFFEYFFDGFLTPSEIDEYFEVIEKLGVYPKYINEFEKVAKFIFYTPEMIETSSIKESVEINFFYNGEQIIDNVEQKHDQYSIFAVYNAFFFALFHQLGYVYNNDDFVLYQTALLNIFSKNQHLDRTSLIEKIADFHVSFDFFNLSKYFDRYKNTLHANRKLFQLLIMVYLENPTCLYHFLAAIQFQLNGIDDEQLKTIEITFGRDYLAKFSYLFSFKQPELYTTLESLFSDKYKFGENGYYNNTISAYFGKTPSPLDYQQTCEMSFNEFVSLFDKVNEFDVNTYTEKSFQIFHEHSITDQKNQIAFDAFGDDYELVILYSLIYHSYNEFSSFNDSTILDFLNCNCDNLFLNLKLRDSLTPLLQSNILSNRCKNQIITKLEVRLSFDQFISLQNNIYQFQNSEQKVTISGIRSDDTMREYRLLYHINLPYIIKTYGMINETYTDPLLIVKDYYGRTLDDYLNSKTCTHDDLSKIIVRLTYCLAFLESLGLLPFLNSIDANKIYLTDDLIPIVYDFSFDVHDNDYIEKYFAIFESAFSNENENSSFRLLQRINRKILNFGAIFRFLTSKYFHNCFEDLDYEQYQRFIDSEFRMIFDEIEYQSMFVYLFGSDYHFKLRYLLDSKSMNLSEISYDTFCKRTKHLYDQNKLNEIGEFYENTFNHSIYLPKIFKHSIPEDKYRIKKSNHFNLLEEDLFLNVLKLNNCQKYNDSILSYLYHIDHRYVVDLDFCDSDHNLYFKTPFIPYSKLLSMGAGKLSRFTKSRIALSLRQSLNYLASCDQNKLLDKPFTEKVIYVDNYGDVILLPIKIDPAKDYPKFEEILNRLFELDNQSSNEVHQINTFKFPSSIQQDLHLVCNHVFDEDFTYVLDGKEIDQLRGIFGLNYKKEIGKLNRAQIDNLIGNYNKNARFYFLYAFNYDFSSPLFRYLMNKAVELNSEEAKHILRICDNLQEYVIHFNQLKNMEKIGSGQYSIVFKCQINDKPYAYKQFHPNQMYRNCFSNVTEFLIYQAIIFDKDNCAKFISEELKVGEFGIVMSLYQSLNLNFRIGQDSDFASKLTYIYLIGKGLSLIHSKGFLHRDIKPNNCLLNHNFPVISDLSDTVPQFHNELLFTGTTHFRTEAIRNWQVGDTVDNDIDSYLLTISDILIQSTTPKIVNGFIQANGLIYRTSLQFIFEGIGQKKFKSIDEILSKIDDVLNQGSVYLEQGKNMPQIKQVFSCDVKHDIETILNPELVNVNINDLDSLYQLFSNKSRSDLALIDEFIDCFLVHNENPTNKFVKNKQFYYTEPKIRSFSKFCVLVRFQIGNFSKIDHNSNFFKCFVNTLGQISIEFLQKHSIDQTEFPYLDFINTEMIAEIANSLFDLKCWKSSDFYILLLFNQIPEIISTKFIMKAIISVYNSSYIHEKYKSCLKPLIQQLFAHPIDDREFVENAFKTIIFQNEKYLGLVELIYSTALQNFSFCQNNFLDVLKSNFDYLNDNHDSNDVIQKFFDLVKPHDSITLLEQQQQINQIISSLSQTVNRRQKTAYRRFGRKF